MKRQVEYLWLDGEKPTHTLRSKTRIIDLPEGKEPTLADFPEWGYDGSSTSQAEGNDSDLAIKPVCFVNDPIRGHGNYIVMCEVNYPDGRPHETNTRAQLRKVLEAGGDKHDVLFGFEQEYTLFEGRSPLGWPDNGYPRPQGPFYCGVGADRVYGRELIEAHTQACIEADILLFGVNAEVMPGQWEFQIGYRGFKGEDANALKTCDHHWIATWLLHRIAEEMDVIVSFENKPVKGDWNGAGCHTNFSTKEMRDPSTGKAAVDAAINALSKRHVDHVSVYGYALNERLTGLHETCSIDEFRAGPSDRGASIRIPLATQEKGYGYLEDRRPGANSDPYIVAARIVTTVCGVDESLFTYKTKESEDIHRLERQPQAVSA